MYWKNCEYHNNADLEKTKELDCLVLTLDTWLDQEQFYSSKYNSVNRKPNEIGGELT